MEVWVEHVTVSLNTMSNVAHKRKRLEEILREAERSSTAQPPPRPSPVSEPRLLAPPPMAMVGLAGRYPGADTIDAFWDNLVGKRNCIQELRGERADDYALSGEACNGNGQARIKHFGLLDHVYRFDAPFFNISRREAEVMDPHMRLLLEVVWSCVENAGYRPRSLDRQTGIFTSFYNHEYAGLLGALEVDAASEPYLATATTGAIFANRISFLLGLNGPSEVYNTACSTALVALHRSIQAIAAGDCRQAIIAGVSLLLTPDRVLALSGLGILNETGVCNPYSHPAHREVIGEGVGAIMIKPLARAVEDRDYIYAIIRGTDVNHHGDRSGRMTLPSSEALTDLVATTYRKLGIRPEHIRYIEGHGAGGEADVVELRALQRFLENAGLKRGKVPVGSVKGNIGFGEASGGIAQLTKCALAFHHGQIPATLHFERVDPVFDLEHSLLEISSENAVLGAGGPDGCMSILAYGLGGTNAHAVLSGHTPSPAGLDESPGPFPILLSAASEEILAEYVRQLGAHLRDATTRFRYRSFCGSDRAVLKCAAQTLAGRERHAHQRTVFLVDSLEALQQCCADYLAGTWNERILRPTEPANPANLANPDPVREAAIRWVGGENAAAEACFGPGVYQKLPLPGVPFRGEVYRLKPRNKPSLGGRSDLEDRWIVTRSDSGTIIELTLSPEDCFIAQHLVDGAAVMPGAAYVTLLAQIARRVYHRETCTIENLAWIMPFEIGGSSGTLRFEVAASGAFRISHMELGRLCCKGRLVLKPGPAPAECHPRINAVRLEGLSPIVDKPRYWAIANAQETRQVHGETLRRLTAIYRVGNEMVGVMEPWDTESSDAEIAFFDSALGACRGFSIAASGVPQAVVPFAVERIHLLRPVPTGRTIYAAANERRDALGRYDISIEDGAGEVYAVLEGYYAKPLTSLARTERPSAVRREPSASEPREAAPLRDLLLLEFQRRIAEFLKCDVAAVPLDESLAPLGLDSIGINALTDQIGRSMSFDLPATVFFEYANIRDLVEYLMREFPSEMEAFATGLASPPHEPETTLAQLAGNATPSPARTPHRRLEGVADIAVVGMGGLFPGARNIRELWEKLRVGQDLVTEIPEPRRRSVYRLYADSIRELKGIYGGFVEEADKFDAAFFGFAEDEVMAMDPQQRLFLEAAWAAIEDAGYFPLSLANRKIGVYVGAIVNDYSAYLRDVGYPVSMFHEGTGSSLAGIANRVSYFLNLTGPSQTVDTACCSSLYAIDRAVNDLRHGVCEAALAGGVSFVGTASGYQMYAAMDYLSKDWRCKAFAEGGDGWSKAELFAAVFLKRYEDAIRDQDPIYAVIKATGTNHGGKGYFYTQPNSARHVELIREVYRQAHVDPRSIVHIEAHGSGTEMGDALEFNTLSRALREFAEERGVSLPPNQCGLGSIKSNFGHAEAGAGIAGFIKTVLLLHEASLPPTLHVKTINKHIRLEQSPLYLVREGKTFAESDRAIPSAPRCAGVHSFNFSGAAAHALVAEHVAVSSNGSLGLTRFPVCISAKTPHALAAYCREIAQFLRQTPGTPGWLDRLVYTINRSKSYFACRRGMVIDSVRDLIAKLEAGASIECAATDLRGIKQAPGRVAEYSPLCDENVESLMGRWLREADFDWSVVLKPFSLERLHLPTYPFEHDRSYFPQAGETGVAALRMPKAMAPAMADSVGQASRLPNPSRSPEATPSAIEPLAKTAPAPLDKANPSGTVEEQLTRILAEILSLPSEAIDLDRRVGEYGFDSLKIVALSDALNQRFGLRTMPPDLFEFSTPREMAAFVAASSHNQPAFVPTPAPRTAAHQDGVAIVGMSGQFPGAADLEEFWQNLVAGKDVITEIPPDRWDWKSIFGDPRHEANKTNVRWGGFIDDVTTFDPLFFRISPREAEAMDPQQRLLMMYVWRAIEDAGYRPSSLAGTHTGLFIGTGSTSYNTRVPGGASPSEGYGSTGSIPSIGPNRMSHFLDLHGPSEPVETTCSSSLVAIHRAVLSIQVGECELAIAGGINTIVTAEDHIGFNKAGMLCEDGRCKTFSATANGYVRGEGVGMLVLKPLASAEAAGDRIYGVIRSSAVNHGGHSNSLTAPNPKAQAELLRSAYAKAGIDPRSVGYIEAHGTGTALGDPIEINGLKLAFKALYEATGAPDIPEPHCALASVKTNIGHLELAAGVAGVIKVLLQLQHATLVKNLHCDQVNPYIQLEGSPFYLLLENRPWPQITGPDGRPLPRRAGISSFGFGGVNAHVVIEEYVPAAECQIQPEPAGSHLVVLSAKNDARLEETVRNLEAFLANHPDTHLSDLAYTLQAGREEMEARLALIATSIEDLKVKLQHVLEGCAGIDGCVRGLATGKDEPSRRVTLTPAPASQAELSRLAVHWVKGGAVDWTKFYGGTARRRVSLPAYPFARERCWLEAALRSADTIPASEPAQPEETVYVPRWDEAGPWLERWTARALRTVVIVHSGPASGLPMAFARHCLERFRDAKFVQIEIADRTLEERPNAWQCDRNDVHGFETCLKACAAIDCLFFILNAGLLEPDRPTNDELQLLRLAKTVKRRLTGAESMDFFVVTVDNFRVADAAVCPAGGGLTGLAYSIAQGDHRLRVRNIDLSVEDTDAPGSPPALLDGILAEAASHRGEVIKFYAGLRYRQTLIPFAWPNDSGEGFRQNGVYAILGGGGHVGDIVTRELIRQYGAKVIWLGRSPADDPGMRAKLDAYRELPGQPVYIQADALDPGSLGRAVQKIKADYGTIHGALFAGAVFSFHNPVAETSEADFTRILEIKTRGSLNFYEAFKDEPLDFMCFFSSAQAFSFSGAASLSAYAAGITFSDSLARSLRDSAAFPVGSVNWGFWESTRGEPSAAENIGFLDAGTATDALKRFVELLRARVLNQMLCLRASKAVRDLMPIDGDRMLVARETSAPQPGEVLARAGLDRPALTDTPGAEEFDDWMVKLLFAQIRDLSLLEGNPDAATPGLRQWLLETRRLLEGKRAVVDPEAATADVWAAWNSRKPVLRLERQLEAQIDLAEVCLRQLPQVLRGQVRPTDVLFPNGSMEKVERVYADHSQFTYFSKVVADAVRAYIEHHRTVDPQFRARILEIGAGTGGTTAVILAGLRELEPCVEEYCYSDVSRAFLDHGERAFSGGRLFLKFKRLDIEQAPAADDPGLGSYDLVIAANVLHATRDIRRTLRHAKAALKRHGQLILDEIAGPSLFAHLTFGLLPGWWLFGDASLRIPGSPGLYPQSWERVLREEGFGSVAFPAHAAHRFGQQVIVADSDGLIRVEKRATIERTEGVVQKREALKPSALAPGGSRNAVKDRMIGLLSEFLKIPGSQLAHDTPFSDYGVDSILGTTFVDRLGTALGLELNSAILFEHATIDQLSAFISETYGDRLQAEAGGPKPVHSSDAPLAAETARATRELPVAAGNGEIAVIGMAGQFPGAKDVETLWRNLIEGIDAVRELPTPYSDPVNSSNLSAEAGKPGSWRGGILEDRACFDPFFFNISPREAESMNPHQRLILQESWKALEDAGVNPRSLGGQAVGLFIGAEPCGYEHESFTGSSDAIVASRLSYYLDLKGPALVVNTGCSSSATAIHLACESLRRGESKLALAGGVFAVLSQELLARLSAMDMLSPTGGCHSFDAAADGTIFSEGVGVVVLKRYADALADGDPIYGVIQASGMNQDGASNGITAPNGAAQEALLVDIYRRFGIDPAEISYIEAHGTGTRLGDPVEANALVRAFKRFTAKQRFCAVGSVKAAVGHASAAAGVIGLIKLLLMMKHGKIPAMGHFMRLNPLIEFDHSAFHVNTATLDWPAEGGMPRVAALNSFGHSGTNVHLVVRSHDTLPVVSDDHGPWVIVLSAKDEDRLREAAERLAAFLETHSACDLRAAAYTLQVGRESMRERLALVIHEAAELPSKLKAWLGGDCRMTACWRGTADPQDRAIQLLQSDEESDAMVARWIAQGKLDKLAELWTLGATIDWRLLYQDPRPARLRLPTYPFAREHYWAPQPGPRAQMPGASIRPAEEDRVLFFEETWDRLVENAVPPTTPENRVNTLLCLLSEPGNQAAWRQAVQELDPRTQVSFVTQADVGSEQGAQSFGNILAQAEPANALLYLWPVEDRRLRADISSLIGLLKAVAAAKTKPKRIVLAGTFENGLERCHLESWIGIERSLGLVLPDVKVAVLLMPTSATHDMPTLAKRVWSMVSDDRSTSVLYENGVAHVLRVHPVQLRPAHPLHLDGKTVLITGGCGGLGLEVARRLAARWRVNLVLTGRSALSPGLQGVLASLAAPGRAVHYGQADVCDAAAMGLALREARAKVGPIHGVIHAAGIKDTRTIFEKGAADVLAVMAPKITGTLGLDEMLARDPLEFVCYFSSSAAVLGDFGACDYAVANRFQVAYAAYRNTLVAAGKRTGRTRVICWTMWSDTGMGRGMDGDGAVFLKSSGQRPLRIEEGLEAFEQLLSQPETQHLVLAGKEAQVRRALRCDPTPLPQARTDGPPAATPSTLPAPALTGDRLLSDLREQLSGLFKIPPAKLDDRRDFADFGIDSIGLTEFARLLSTLYRVEFTPSVFFGHSTLAALAGYLVEKHPAMVRAFCGSEPLIPESSTTATTATTAIPQTLAPAASDHRLSNVQEPIAIIGMSGRFPGARNLEEMWQILVEGRNAVGAMPADRCDERALPGPSSQDKPANAPSCGCIPGVKEFDPAFFEISPAEAEEMDPRQRLLLQEGWNALEDAGLGPSDLERQRIAMFVGVEEGDYPRRTTEGSITSNHTGVLGARLAYFLNLRGPVMSINTSCSSSSVALHQACQSLRDGECDAALVAGVNLILDPDTLDSMAQAGMLSPDGTCYAFDRRANGMVPGEAVAVIVLKPLSRAVAEGDPIDAVILGSGINYDGKTNGITAPNGVAQAELVRTVLDKAGIQPGQVEYIVTHGTGTRLGDPVEVNALSDAFCGGRTTTAHDTVATPARCALTSCKTNFGHTFAASGLVNVIALVQSMRHQTIPASLHFRERNEFIQWENSPFYVNAANQPWPARPDRARIGAVSAFGMSGTNAHVILRDHAASASTNTGLPRYHLLAWSAKSADALRERLRRFARLVETGGVTDAQLPEISRTLLLGRHHFAHRRAIVVQRLAEAIEALSVGEPTSRPSVFEGTVEVAFRSAKRVREQVKQPPAQGVPAGTSPTDSADALCAVAEQWCQGTEVDWSRLFDGNPPRRIHLPTYPFARREYWLEPGVGPSPETRLPAPPPTETPAPWLRLPATDAEMFSRLLHTQDQDMDRLLADLLAATLNSLGLREEHKRLAPIAGRQSVPAHFEKWLEESRRLLRESAPSNTGSRPLEMVWADWDNAKARWMGNPCLKNQVALVERCIRALPEVLRGERRWIDVLFPDSSVEFVEAVYHDNPVADAFNKVVGQAVAAWVQHRLVQDPDARIRVLEIGAGTGGTTSVVLPLLAPFKDHLEEYSYTDVSRAFLLHAEERFVPAHPYVVPRLFDVSRPVAGQEIAARSYDLVIAANVLHATPDIRQAIRNAASTLRRDGVLVLNELSTNGWFTHLAFGLLEGWWLYQDEELRQRGCPAVSTDTWRRLLKDEGFEAVHFPAEIGHALGQQVIVAESLGVIEGLPNGATDAPLMYAETNGEAGETPAPLRAEDKAGETPAPLYAELRRLGIDYFKRLVGAALKMDADDLDPAAPLEMYGLDSLMIGRVLAKLRESFKDIPGTLLFEVRTVGALTDYFVSNHKADLMERLGMNSAPPEPPKPMVRNAGRDPVVTARTRPTSSRAAAHDPREPIAIIGLSGHFPSAPDLRTFWENLKAGKDCITEIPPERWSLEGFYEPEIEEAIDTGKSFCKWGGFLDGCWNFDPLFFNMSPRGAVETDPQERLFLQAAWECLEDAGYTRNTLAERYDGRVGVFTGIAHSEFNVLGPDLWRQGKWVYPHTSFGSVPNHVSFLFNLNGPSFPVDTMCSSALTALHEACESILRGECLMAIAGAVNLYLHPSTYVFLCASRLLANGPQCHSFGLGDDGFVPGEGVGVVLLKRLSEAVRDGDRIHAIIRGTAVNHGGRTNGFTVPNPNAQAKVIRQALDNAGVDARTVSYVETHGAGSKLGDPIEVLGLTRAFRQDTPEAGFCSIGSVKSNIGHLEAAAGIVGLTKVILQMQHRQLVPSLHSATLNPEIRFEDTPFIVQQKLEPWERPTITANGSTVTHPRIAGVSSFGAGGANAHVILEEYEDTRPHYDGGSNPCLIVLSARNPIRLKESAARLRQFLAENPELDLPDIAYTLQIGREAMEERVGFVAPSVTDLANRLAAFLEDKPGGFVRGQSRAGKGAAERFLDAADLEDLLAKWVGAGDFAKILDVWVRGYGVDWNRLYPAGAPRRIGLPGYPFAKERYWLLDPPRTNPQDQKPVPPDPSGVTANSWLFFREEWEPQAIPDAIDWRERLAGYAGKRIAVAAVDLVEADALVSLLRQLEAESGLAPSMRISALEMDPDTKVVEPPDVVLFLGPRVEDRQKVAPSEKNLSDVFHLSRRLMNAGWGEPVAIYYLYESGEAAPRVDCEALSGFIRAAMKENEQHVWTLVGDYGRDPRLTRLQLLVREWLFGSSGSVEIRYEKGTRRVRKLTEISVQPGDRAPFRRNGVYVLAGGMGYVGQQLSLELARRYQATLVLLTRGGMDESRQAHCRALEALGAKVICESVDITDRPRFEAVYQKIARQVGPIHGVFHLARHHEDQMIARKPWPSFVRVIQPKVHGMLYLDELTKNEPLDFFAVFSSLGAYGVRGSSDYSYSTAFQNAFSTLRNRWVKEGKRSGATISMCWGPWLEDHLFPESRAHLVEAGFGLIDIATGFEAMGTALAGGLSPLAMMKVRDGMKVRSLLGLAAKHSPVPEVNTDEGKGVDGLEQLVADWEQRRSRGEDVSGTVAERISTNKLNGLPDPLVQRVYQLLFGTNGKRGGDGETIGLAVETKPAVGMQARCPHHHEETLGPVVETKPHPGAGIDEVTKIVRTALAEVLQLTEIDDERSFMEYGLDSIAGMQLAVRLERRLKREVQPGSLVIFPTVAALCEHLRS